MIRATIKDLIDAGEFNQVIMMEIKRENTGAAQTPIEDLKKAALEHYNEASSKIHHYNSDIPKAIEYYYDSLGKSGIDSIGPRIDGNQIVNEFLKFKNTNEMVSSLSTRRTLKNPHYDDNGNLDGGDVYIDGEYSHHIDPKGPKGAKGKSGSPNKSISKKPPIGLVPRYIHDENRLDDVYSAITRYYHDRLPIPIEWVDEYNKLIKGI